MKYEEILEKKSKIISSPVKPIPEDKLNAIKEDFQKRHQKSFEKYQEAQKCIPGGVQHNLATTNPFPLTMDRADGYMMYDIDGNEYVDYLMCGGPIILGHNYRPLTDEIIKLLQEKGPNTGLTTEWEILAANEIKKNMPHIDLVRFFQSGTESVTAAIRIARVYTGKKKIIKIEANYHGWGDQTVHAMHIVGTGPMLAQGIPPECLKNTVGVKPNDFDGLRKAFEDNQDKGKIAAVLVEANGGEAGTHPVHPEWNKHVRQLCDEFGAVMIMDEVITGFRLAYGGAAEYYDVKPDLTIMGKVIMHGFPSCGAVAGKKEVMAVCSAGAGGAVGKHAFVAGTLAGNAISSAACYHAIRLLSETKAIDKASAFGDRLTEELNSLFQTRPDLPFFAYNMGSIIIYDTTAYFSVDITKSKNPLGEILERKKIAEEYQIVTINEGITSLAGSRMYTCMAHDDNALDKTLKAWDKLLSLIPK